MSLLKNRWVWLSGLGVVLFGGLLLVVVGYVGLVVATGVMTGTPLVSVLLDIALPAIVAVSVLLVGFGLSAVGLLWVLVRSTSFPQSDRLASAAERAEREYPQLRSVGLSELLEPPEPSADEQAERALADLKQQYVDGEITEAEFERKVNRLVSNESIDEARAARERQQVKDADVERH